MLYKQTFYATGETNVETAAKLNKQIKDFMVGTGLFVLVSEEIGNYGKPNYGLKHIHSNYKISLYTRNDNYYPELVFGTDRNNIATLEQRPRFGNNQNAAISVHIIDSGKSFCFKVLNVDGEVAMGGYSLRYKAISGEEGFIYSTNGAHSKVGEMGSGVDEQMRACKITYTDYFDPTYALVQDQPLIVYEKIPVGYALDVMTLNLVGINKTSRELSVYVLGDTEYYGTPLSYDGTYYYAPNTAVVMKR